MTKLRIRHCKGNKDAWMLIALDSDGNEIDGHGEYTTADSLDDLLKYAPGHLKPQRGVGVVIEFVA